MTSFLGTKGFPGYAKYVNMAGVEEATSDPLLDAIFEKGMNVTLLLNRLLLTTKCSSSKLHNHIKNQIIRKLFFRMFLCALKLNLALTTHLVL